VTLVVVGHRAGATLLHRQTRLGPIKGLNLALLIDRQDIGVVGRRGGQRQMLKFDVGFFTQLAYLERRW